MTNLMRQVQSREFTLAAVALGVLLLAAVLMSSVAAIFSRQSKEIDSSLLRLANLKADVASRPQLEEALRLARRNAAQLPGFYQGANAGLAGAQLESDVKSLVSSNGGEIRSAQILPAKHEKGLDALSVQYDLTVPQRQLAPLLHAIESHSPYLLIDSLDVSGSQAFQTGQSQDVDNVLSVRWTVRAYRWSGSR